MMMSAACTISSRASTASWVSILAMTRAPLPSHARLAAEDVLGRPHEGDGDGVDAGVEHAVEEAEVVGASA